MSDTVIKVENLSKQYRIGSRETGYRTFRETLVDAAKAPFQHMRSMFTRHSSLVTHHSETIWALRDVSFEVTQGEVVGIIGRNGAGKSTLLKILSKITEPTEGRVELRGRIGSLLEVGTGFHPELTGHENVYLYGAILGMDRWEITRKFDEIIAFAELEKFVDTPVKRYSSGMYMRLAFAVAAHLEPEILLVDEVLAVGDAAFQKKCLGKMGDVSKEGRTVLFVSHSMPAILNLCSVGILLDSGKICEKGAVPQVVDTYLRESLDIEGEVILPDNRPQPKSELRFLSARIKDFDGKLSAHVDIRGFTLELDYEVSLPIRSAQVTLELWNSMGICVLCSSDFDENPEDIKKIKQPGRYRVSCFINPMFLRPGRYWIDLGSSIPGVRVLDEFRNVIAFEVIDSGSLDFKFAHGRRGVIAPILKWKTGRL